MSLIVYPGHPDHDPEFDPKGEGHGLEYINCEAFRDDGKVCDDVGYSFSEGRVVCKAHLALDESVRRQLLVN
jgi:hypothetical protein